MLAAGLATITVLGTAWAQQAPPARIRGIIEAVDGPMLTMKYTDGEKKISVPNNATIVQFVNGDRSELKPGAKIFIAAGTKKPDGTIETAGVNVGRDGITPPM